MNWHFLEPLIFEFKVIPFLKFYDVLVVSEVSKDFNQKLHELELHNEAHIHTAVSDLLQIVSCWRNLKRLFYKPILDPDYARNHENIYNVLRSDGALVIEPQSIEIPLPRLPPVLASIVGIYCLDLSGIQDIECCEGMHRIQCIR